MPTYLQGLTIGLAYVAPIGMQNLFVINSALTQPRRRALLTALIVIAFDISLALACFFGIGALVERFDWLQRLILIVGGCIVVWIGIGLLRDKPTLDRDVDVSIPLPKLAAKAFVVTWINPQALIDGTMLFGSFRAGNPGAVASQLMLGSASASCLWFLGITILISFFSAKFNDKILRTDHHLLRSQAAPPVLPDPAVIYQKAPPLRRGGAFWSIYCRVSKLTSTSVILVRAWAGIYSCTPWKFTPPVHRLGQGRPM